MSPSRRPSVRSATAVLVTAATCALLLAGCDGSSGDGDVMVMRPAEARPTTDRAAPPTTVPAEVVATTPADGGAGEVMLAAAPSWISIDNEPYEFPPAKLFLKRSGDRVKVKLFGKAPDDAADRGAGWAGQSFYFEIEIELPPESAGAGATDAVSPQELASAEWAFHANASERSESPSGIVLGRQSTLLQPSDVLMSFDPLDDNLVSVTLVGTFSEFDTRKPRDAARERQVSVQAVLSAETLRR